MNPMSFGGEGRKCHAGREAAGRAVEQDEARVRTIGEGAVQERKVSQALESRAEGGRNDKSPAGSVGTHVHQGHYC